MLTVLRHATVLPFTSGCRVATGRSAILHMAKRWQPDYVFMPCYVPEGVIRPFQAAGVNVVFYELQSNLRPNLPDLSAKMAANKGERPVIVLIHYFGMDMGSAAIRNIADSNDALLFSDCAHALLDGSCADQSDVILYSLNKFLAVTDGAIMVSRLADLDLSIEEDTLPVLPLAARVAYQQHLSANGEIAASQPGRDITDLMFASNAHYERYYRFIDSDMDIKSQSAESRAVEAVTDFRKMGDYRISNSNWLIESLPEINLISQSLPQFAFPIRCNGKLDEIAAALVNEGILPTTLSNKWDHIPLEGYEVEAAFCEDHLLLPIGEGVNPEHIALMADVIGGVA